MFTVIIASIAIGLLFWDLFVGRCEVYSHPSRGYSAVRIGFSWRAWYFTWLWAFVNRLWGVGFVFFIFQGLLIGLIVTGLISPVWAAVFAPISMVFAIQGNTWKAEKLERDGYIYCGDLSAFEATALSFSLASAKAKAEKMAEFASKRSGASALVNP